MTERERLDILWKDHHFHIDDHRKLSKHFDMLTEALHDFEKRLIALEKRLRTPISLETEE